MSIRTANDAAMRMVRPAVHSSVGPARCAWVEPGAPGHRGRVVTECDWGIIVSALGAGSARLRAWPGEGGRQPPFGIDSAVRRATLLEAALVACSLSCGVSRDRHGRSRVLGISVDLRQSVDVREGTRRDPCAAPLPAAGVFAIEQAPVRYLSECGGTRRARSRPRIDAVLPPARRASVRWFPVDAVDVYRHIVQPLNARRRWVTRTSRCATLSVASTLDDAPYKLAWRPKQW